jgi:serine/threonine protein kinase
MVANGDKIRLKKNVPHSNKTSRQPSIANLQHISPSDVKLQVIIGEGEFGTVYKGTYKSKQVAIKKLKDCSADREFLREANIMGQLGNHPCILKIFGLVVDRNSLMMVQELMVCSLLEKLLNEPGLVTEVHLKNWSAQIVTGMKHMEEKKIVHRDLAARNVLLASDMQIKISDFGLSRQTDSSNVYTQKTDGKIPIKW